MPDHISICICTFKRPALLQRLLSSLESQETSGHFGYSIVVVDNDKHESGRSAVEAFARKSKTAVNYFVEREQNIALARNMAVSNAAGNLFAFIDDDEIPIRDWLLRLYSTCLKHRADGVFGPVVPIFQVDPSPWMLKAVLFDRPSYARTGVEIEWKRTGMGNALVRRKVVDRLVGPFDKKFGSGGEDIDFFRRAIGRGHSFIWCAEGTVYEAVAIERTRLSFQLKRALLRGKSSLQHPGGRTYGIAKSMLATLLYTMLLPAFLLFGRHMFIRYLVKDFDHVGKLLAACGIDLVKDRYV